MSDRTTTPTKDALSEFRQETDEGVKILQQRPQGAPNGLIVPAVAGIARAGTWLALAGYQNNWAATNIVDQQLPQYTLDADGFVHLRGHVRNSAAWVNSIAAVIPAGYLPKGRESFATAAGSNGVPGTGVAVLQVDTVGNLVLLAVVTAVWNAVNWVSLSGISYYVGSQ